ncbi:MAG TPA: TRAP transporter small permease [Thermoanaerobacterales bacterium]|nr:TRAP transporter small permease [Thermoanaerobacterales bacterium]
MKKILDKIADLLANISSALFIIIFAINMLEIISRTFINYSLLWVSDVTVICVVWMICLSMAVAVYHKEHLIMDFLVNKMPKKVQRILTIAINIICIAFFFMLFYTGLQTAATKKALIYPSIMWSQLWSYSALPVFAILSAIFMIPRLISSFKGNTATEAK